MNKSGGAISLMQKRLVFPEAAAFNRIVAKDKILKQNMAPPGVTVRGVLFAFAKMWVGTMPWTS